MSSDLSDAQFERVGFLNAIRKNILSIVVFFVCICLIVSTFIIWESLPPKDFPLNDIITIKAGSGLSSIADQLVSEHIIRSALLYKAYSVLLRDGHSVQAGDYLFDAPESALRVAYRTVNGIYDLPKIKVMIPEGAASFDIAKTFAKNMP